jgi:hypothetical protein
MQLRLPLYPKEATLLSEFIGVYEKESIVQYIINGVPSYAHKSVDYRSFRYITSNYIDMKLCNKADVCRCFQVSPESVTKWHNKYVTEGGDGFFGQESRMGGKSYKLTGDVLIRIQGKLDEGRSNLSIAKEEGIRESAIRYAIKKGYLKKSLVKNLLSLPLQAQ